MVLAMGFEGGGGACSALLTDWNHNEAACDKYGIDLMCCCYDTDIQENLATSITSPLIKSMSTSIIEPEGADFFVR